MTIGDWIIYNDYLLNEGKADFNYPSHVLKVALFDISSSAGSESVAGAGYTAFAADGHEMPTEHGYTAGGQVVPDVTWEGGGVLAISTLAGGIVGWTGTDEGFSPTFAVLYDDSAVGKPAIAFCTLTGIVDPDNPFSMNVGTVFTKSIGAYVA